MAATPARRVEPPNRRPRPLRFLIDSVILIDHFNNIVPASQWLANHAAESSISVITRAEILAGFEAAQVALAQELLDHFPALPITVEIADRAAAFRRTERLKLPDALQAAVAAHHALILVTRNTRDFQTNREFKVLAPYKL